MTLTDFFDKLRFWGGERNRLLQSLRLYGIWNKFTEIAANAILPIYFSMTKNNPDNHLRCSNDSPKIIVSLTSFPKRIPTLHLVIETILRQTVKPDKIILHLTQSQIKDIDTLPKKLLDQRNRGLEIVLCPDEIRSHTKYYYAFRDYPDATVITVDDDLYYRSDLIESLLKSAENHPGCIIANWVKEIVPGKLRYNEWPDLSNTPKLSKNLLILGVGSVLYPPKSVHEDIFDIENIRTLSLTADDIWITAMILKKGTSVYYTAYKYNHLPVIIKNNETLISGNYVRNQQCVDAINDYYAQNGSKRPFIDITERN